MGMGRFEVLVFGMGYGMRCGCRCCCEGMVRPE